MSSPAVAQELLSPERQPEFNRYDERREIYTKRINPPKREEGVQPAEASRGAVNPADGVRHTERVVMVGFEATPTATARASRSRRLPTNPDARCRASLNARSPRTDWSPPRPSHGEPTKVVVWCTVAPG